MRRTEAYILGYQGPIRERANVSINTSVGCKLIPDARRPRVNRFRDVVEKRHQPTDAEILSSAIVLSQSFDALQKTTVSGFNNALVDTLPAHWKPLENTMLARLSTEQLQQRVHTRREEITLLDQATAIARDRSKNRDYSDMQDVIPDPQKLPQLQNDFVTGRALISGAVHKHELRVLRKRAKVAKEQARKMKQETISKRHQDLTESNRVEGTIVVFPQQSHEQPVVQRRRRGAKRPKDMYTLGLRMMQAGIADIRKAVKEKKLKKGQAKDKIRELQLREKLLRAQRGDFNNAKKINKLKPRWEQELRELTQRLR